MTDKVIWESTLDFVFLEKSRLKMKIRKKNDGTWKFLREPESGQA